MQSYHTQLLPHDNSYRSIDNSSLEPLSKGKASPFVKWAGGKRSIIFTINDFLPVNIEAYHEPFLGGGAVFFAFEDRIKTATLADLNEELVIAYRTISQQTNEVISALEKHAANHKSKDYYIKVRNQKPKDPVDITARFLYLNKTCYNGLYRVNKSGKFNVPQGKYKNPKICDPTNLKNVAKVLEKATIRIGQFDETITPTSGDFVYCDPPYDGTFTGYQAQGFKDADQERLKDMVDLWTKQKVSVMVSNSDTSFIRNLYKNYHIHFITAYRHISSNGKTRGKKPEVLITNYEHRKNTLRK